MPAVFPSRILLGFFQHYISSQGQMCVVHSLGGRPCLEVFAGVLYSLIVRFNKALLNFFKP